MQAPLTSRQYRLQKFPGKGGWTYTEIPEVSLDRKAPFGWVLVKGRIDDYPIKRYRLMPLGNGNLFFPVRAEIRKKIGKGAGDLVFIELFADDSSLAIPPELEACLKDEPDAHSRFLSLPHNQQEAWIKWIYGAKETTTRVARIANTIDKLLKGETLLRNKKAPSGA